jgi:VWFA-related protein
MALMPHTPRNISRFLPAALAFLLLLALPLSAVLAQGKAGPSGKDAKAAEEEPQEEFFGESVDVNVVNVEVYVTDKDGKRVRGLKQDDFVLQVDKKPVAITNFYAVDNGKAREDVVLDSAPEAEPGEAALPRIAEEEIPDEQRLYLVVYIDNFNLRPFSRNRVIQATRTFLRSRVRQGDQVMLVTYDRSLKVRHPFTKDPEVVASALSEIETQSGYGTHFDSDRRDLLDFIYNDARSVTEASGRATSYAESLYNDMSFTLDAIGKQVEILGGLPGRKAVLYVSDGLSMRPGEDIFYALNDKFREQASLTEIFRFDLSRRFDALINQANANRLTFYTVDASGLRTYSYMDASNHTAGGGAQIDQTHFSNIQSSIRFMAEETGGFSIINTNNFTPMLDRMAEDFGNYYSLGFQPATSGVAGRYHSIKVLLKNKMKGVQLRFREGYRDRPIASRMADSTMAALNFGYAKNPLGAEVTSGRQEIQESGQYLVPLTVKIPIGKMTFMPTDGVQRARLRLFVAAKDADGGIADVQELPLPIDIPDAEFEQAKNQTYSYKVVMLMRAGPQVVSVGIRDEIGASSSVATHGLRVGGGGG